MIECGALHFLGVRQLRKRRCCGRTNLYSINILTAHIQGTRACTVLVYLGLTSTGQLRFEAFNQTWGMKNPAVWLKKWLRCAVHASGNSSSLKRGIREAFLSLVLFNTNQKLWHHFRFISSFIVNLDGLPFKLSRFKLREDTEFPTSSSIYSEHMLKYT